MIFNPVISSGADPEYGPFQIHVIPPDEVYYVTWTIPKMMTWQDVADAGLYGIVITPEGYVSETEYDARMDFKGWSGNYSGDVQLAEYWIVPNGYYEQYI